ncbi:hypothetical protein BGZ63DRAFT_456956 [Mariannaea sp. PMI_226]|nr:hypothetical protein BGZ63DRAFT_456956 [Mariannaea sp. PMI_226]
MGYPTDETNWPLATPSSVIELLDLLFSLVDTKSETIGKRLAEEVFTQGGIFMATSGSFQGHLAIETCRKGVWNTVLSRRHQVKKAFINDKDGDVLDLILVGAVDVESAETGKHRHEFVVRSVVVGTDSATPRVQHYQVLIPTPKTPQTILA